MRVLITGVDGYLGWTLAIYLAHRGHEVAGIDNYARRLWVGQMGSQSAIPIASMAERLSAYREHAGQNLRFYRGDLTDYNFVLNAYKSFRPDAIVYLGEMPSAPYSMIDVQNAVYTQTNNIMGTLVSLYAIQEAVPECHLVKLGTMGEYGTPNIDIEEGWITIEHNGRSDTVLYPKRPGSFYHLSKVHDSHNIEFTCRIWKLRATDLNQGIVYGIESEQTKLAPDLRTSFHYDAVFGTVVNRFLVQAAVGVRFDTRLLGLLQQVEAHRARRVVVCVPARQALVVVVTIPASRRLLEDRVLEM